MKVAWTPLSIGDVMKYVLLIAILTVAGSVILAGVIEVDTIVGEWIIRWFNR